MDSQIFTKAWEVEQKYHVLNLTTLEDTLLSRADVAMLLGTKDFHTKHSIKIGNLIIEPSTVVFVKIPKSKKRK